MIIAAAVLAASCGGRSVQSIPEGSLGGPCDAARRCDAGLVCFRGLCLEPERDGGTFPPGVDGGPAPRPGTDGGPAWDFGSPSTTDAGPSRPPAGPGVVTSGLGRLIAVFPVASGLLVVDDTEVRLVGRDGSALGSFSTGRQITAAAFDGTYLGIADRARLTTLEPDLTEVADGLLTEYCSDAAIVSDHRFLCGPDERWMRIFATHDLETGDRIATSSDYTYNGVTMHRVPGSDDFVSVSGGSPSDFHLYTMVGDTVTYVNDSPYHGDFAVTNVLAFHGVPATHVVTEEGIMLRIEGATCEVDTYPSTCLERDGDLGTLDVGERYAAMTEDGDGYIYGLLDPSDRWFDDPYCEMGCDLQRIDSAARTVLSERSYATTFLAAPVFEHDAWSGRVVLGAQTAGDRLDGYTEYEVRLIEYE